MDAKRAAMEGRRLSSERIYKNLGNGLVAAAEGISFPFILCFSIAFTVAASRAQF